MYVHSLRTLAPFLASTVALKWLHEADVHFCFHNPDCFADYTNGSSAVASIGVLLVAGCFIAAGCLWLSACGTAAAALIAHDLSMQVLPNH